MLQYIDNPIRAHFCAILPCTLLSFGQFSLSAYAHCAGDNKRHSSTNHTDVYHISGRHNLKQVVREAATICPRPCKLTFDLLILKVASESRVTRATPLPILVFPGLSVLDLGPMYARDKRQTRIIAWCPYLRGGGHKNHNIKWVPRLWWFLVIFYVSCVNWQYNINLLCTLFIQAEIINNRQ